MEILKFYASHFAGTNNLFFLQYHGLTHAGFLFSAHGTSMIYFFACGHVQEFFSDTNMCAGYFFSLSPNPPSPPHSKVKWFAP